MNSRPKKINILLFWFHDDWGMYGRAYERVAENLANLPEVGQVVCVFPPVSVNQHAKKDRLRVRQISQKLALLTETDFNRISLGRPFTRVRQSLNHFFRNRALKAYFRKLGFRADNTLLWLFPPHPYIERLLETIPHCGVITHVIDNFTKFDRTHFLYAFAQDQYPKLGEWSDIIITTAEANRKAFATSGAPCFLFYPAVDERFIGKPATLPHRISGKAPRLGYVGWIMDRTDLELIMFIASQRPQWRILLAGPQYPDRYLDQSGLLEAPNVEYLGPLLQEDVPDFLYSLDVCLLPHRDTEYSRSMGPLKLYQYLASGRPIVSTNVAGVERVSDSILIAEDANEFLEHIEEALKVDTIELSASRIEIAKKNTWPIRVNEMFNLIKERL